MHFYFASFQIHANEIKLRYSSKWSDSFHLCWDTTSSNFCQENCNRFEILVDDTPSSFISNLLRNVCQCVNQQKCPIDWMLTTCLLACARTFDHANNSALFQVKKSITFGQCAFEFCCVLHFAGVFNYVCFFIHLRILSIVVYSLE